VAVAHLGHRIAGISRVCSGLGYRESAAAVLPLGASTIMTFLLGNLGNCELTLALSRQQEPSGVARILAWCSASYCFFPSVQSSKKSLHTMKPLYPLVARFPWGSSVCGSTASLRAAIADRIPETGKTGSAILPIRNRDRWAYRYVPAQRVAADRAPDSPQSGGISHMKTLASVCGNWRPKRDFGTLSLTATFRCLVLERSMKVSIRAALGYRPPVRRSLSSDSLEPLPAGVRLIAMKASRIAPDPPDPSSDYAF
jgi:hypothetical protein